MLPEDIKKKLEEEIQELKALLQEREAALPAHSIRPHQMQGVIELEDEIAKKEVQLKKAKGLSRK